MAGVFLIFLPEGGSKIRVVQIRFLKKAENPLI